MKKCLITAIPLAALSACSGPASDSLLQPGQWEVSAGPSEFDVPGASREQMAQFEAMLAEKETQQQCLSQAEADQGLEPLAKEFGKNGDCKVAEFDASNGQITGTMSCKIDGVDELAATKIVGSYDDEKFDMDLEISMAMPEWPQGQGSMTVSINGKRTGDCS